MIDMSSTGGREVLPLTSFHRATSLFHCDQAVTPVQILGNTKVITAGKKRREPQISWDGFGSMHQSVTISATFRCVLCMSRSRGTTDKKLSNEWGFKEKLSRTVSRCFRAEIFWFFFGKYTPLYVCVYGTGIFFLVLFLLFLFFLQYLELINDGDKCAAHITPQKNFSRRLLKLSDNVFFGRW